MTPVLRPYQVAGLAAVEARFDAGDRGTLLVLATGLGKTVVFAELARRRVTAGHRCLVLAHRDELLDQALEKLVTLGVRAAIEQGPARAGDADVVVASVQTLRGARLASWPADTFDLVIIDESHHATAASYRAIVDHFASAKVLGVTATPDRADGKGLGEVFGSVAFEFDLRAGIKAGFLAPVRARRVQLKVDLDAVKTTAGDLNQGQLGEVMTDPDVIEATARAVLESVGTRPTVLFTVTVAHAHLLAEACNLHRPGSARAVSGKASKDERRAAKDDLASGAVQIIANASLWTEGFDCPPVAAIAIARPTKSRALFAQMVGRGTRLHPGKEDCLVLDFAGLTGRHQLVTSIDVLADRDVPEGVRALLAKKYDHDIDVDAEVAAIKGELERARFAPTVKWLAEDVADLLGEVSPALLGEGMSPATEQQVAMLHERGVKPPAGLTDLAAARILALVEQRRRSGLCSIKQVKFMGALGIDRAHAKGFSYSEAAYAIGALKPMLDRHASHRERAPAIAQVLQRIADNRNANVTHPDAPDPERRNWKRHR